MRLADDRKQDPEIIVNFRGGRDGGTRISDGASLFDGNGRRKTFDEIDVRLLHLIEKLPRVSGQAFDVAALTFRIERVERERRLARSAHSGEYNQSFPRKLDTDVLQIVLAGANYANGLSSHRSKAGKQSPKHKTPPPTSAFGRFRT